VSVLPSSVAESSFTKLVPDCQMSRLVETAA